jgi:hypothetical protein
MIERIREQKDLFSIYTIQYSVVTFHMKDKHGTISDALTRKVGANTKNTVEGFSSPN